MIIYRSAKPEDISDILSILRATKIAESVAGAVSGYIIAQDDEGNRVGCAGLDSVGQSNAVLVNVAVLKPYRKQGIASAMIHELELRCRLAGVHTISLCTMYYCYNFFKRRGWVVTKRAELPYPINKYRQFTSKRYKKCGCMVKVL